MDDKLTKLESYLSETVRYFLSKVEGVDRDRYTADRDIRYILDKAINDIILCMVDIAEECLKGHDRSVPETYRQTLLACYEFVGDAATKVAPLAKHRNEMIHQYLHVNWQNIVTVKTRIPDILEFADKVHESRERKEKTVGTISDVENTFE